MKLDEKRLKQIGEQFGAQLTSVIDSAMLHSVEVGRVDETYAEVYEFEGDAPIHVPLLALNAGTAMLKVLPKEGSTALILYANGRVEKPIFVGFTEVDEVNVSVGESSVKITDGLIEFNGGENKGMVLVEKLTERLNKLQGEIEQIQTAIMAHTHPTPSGTSGTPTYTKATVSHFDASEYTNDKITQ